MKLKNTTFIILLWAFACLPWAHAQDNRSLETKVADILALFPANGAEESDRLFRELISLPDEALLTVAARVVPNGRPEGIAPRYAVSLLTHHASSAQERARIEQVYLRALKASDNAEVASYFIENLKRIGSDASVLVLQEKISDQTLADQAIGGLVSIGTDKAKDVLLDALQREYPLETQARLIQALGELTVAKAIPLISARATHTDAGIRRQALWALARIGSVESYTVMLAAAQKTGFKDDPSEAAYALVEYIHQLADRGDVSRATKATQVVLDNTETAAQQHIRLAALKALTKVKPDASGKVLLKEIARFDPGYQREVLKIAATGMSLPAVKKQWTKAYQKSKAGNADMLRMLAQADRSDAFIQATLVPALESSDPDVRMTAATELAYSDNKQYHETLIDYLLKAESDEEVAVGKSALLRVMNQEDVSALVEHLENNRPAIRAALIDILGERRATNHFETVAQYTAAQNSLVRKAAFSALPRLASSQNTGALLTILSQSDDAEELKSVQRALIQSIDETSYAAINAAYAENKAKLLPVMPYVNDEHALTKVTNAFDEGTEDERAAAFEALTNWQDHQAVEKLLAIRRDPALEQYHEKAFRALVAQTGRSAWEEDQKLRMLDAAMQTALTNDEKAVVIRTSGSLRSFPALVFVSRYLDDEGLSRVASRSVMQIALPTADGRPGLTGDYVRTTLQSILNKLEGQDSQYEVIDIQTYLADMPASDSDGKPYELTPEEKAEGFEVLFDGRDLNNWIGNKEEYVVDGNTIAFFPKGKGHGNLFTEKEYSNFIFRFEFQLTPGANNGLGIHASLTGDVAYRGKEIQILDDTAPVYANLEPYQYHGSVYGIVPAKRGHLRPVGEWNEQEVYVKGDRIRVVLNGTVIVDADLKKAARNGTMDKKEHPGLKVYRGHIGFLGHGTVVKFRNIRIKDLGR